MSVCQDCGGDHEHCLACAVAERDEETSSDRAFLAGVASAMSYVFILNGTVDDVFDGFCPDHAQLFRHYHEYFSSRLRIRIVKEAQKQARAKREKSTKAAKSLLKAVKAVVKAEGARK